MLGKRQKEPLGGRLRYFWHEAFRHTQKISRVELFPCGESNAFNPPISRNEAEKKALRFVSNLARQSPALSKSFWTHDI